MRAPRSRARLHSDVGTGFTRTFILRHPPPDMEILRGLAADLPEGHVATLAQLEVPILFIRGEHDYVTDADVRRYAEQCRNAEVATIPDAAHLAFIDNPHATVDAVHHFLTRVESTQRNPP